MNVQKTTFTFILYWGVKVIIQKMEHKAVKQTRVLYKLKLNNRKGTTSVILNYRIDTHYLTAPSFTRLCVSQSYIECEGTTEAKLKPHIHIYSMSLQALNLSYLTSLCLSRTLSLL